MNDALPDPEPRIELQRPLVKWSLVVSGLLVAIIVPVMHLTVDPAIARWAAAKPYWLDRFTDYYTELGEGTFWIVPAVLLFALFALLRLHNLARWAFMMFAAVGGAGIVVNLIKMVFARYRPEELFDYGHYGFNWFAYGTPMASFPSGHATTSAAAAWVLVMMFPLLRWVWIPIGLTVGISRIWTTDHYLSDTFAGFLLGTLCTLLAQWIWLRASPATLPVALWPRATRQESGVSPAGP